VTWLGELAQFVDALLYAIAGVLVTFVAAKVTKVDQRVVAAWRTHRAAQKAILANQETILGDRFERPSP
jgi:hypothetical protein